MRAYTELTTEEQGQAVEYHLRGLLQAILEGGIRFNNKLNEDDLQERIDRAMQEAEDMQTPWFAGEYIMEAAGDDLRIMAQCDAEDTQYADAEDAPVVCVSQLVDC